MLTVAKNIVNAFILYETDVFSGLSAGTGKLCIFGHLGLVFIWSCFVSCLLLLLYYVICAPVLTEGTVFSQLFNSEGNYGVTYRNGAYLKATRNDNYDK